MAKLKKYKWQIDENDKDSGVKVISLVDEPAIESDFIAFSKEQKKFVKFEKEGYKQVVAGLAMIPEKEIYRVDKKTGEEYVGSFDAETIEKIRNKFHKEQQTSNVNVDHNQKQSVDGYLIESFILTSDKQVEDLKDKGIKEASIGSWFTAYKIEDKEVFQKVLDGELNGFSVEIYAERILESFKNNNNKVNKFNMKNILVKLKELVNEFEKEHQKFVSAPIADLGITIAQSDYEEWTVGEAIYSLVVTEDGEESQEPIEDGEYALEDGVILVVEEGLLKEVKQPEAPAEEPAEEEMVDEESTTGTTGTTEVVVKSAKETLAELGVDFSQNGYWMIEIGVENGEPVFGQIMSNTYKELKFSLDEVERLKQENEELKLKIKEPIADPKLAIVEVEEKLDYSKMNNLERILRKNKLPLV